MKEEYERNVSRVVSILYINENMFPKTQLDYPVIPAGVLPDIFLQKNNITGRNIIDTERIKRFIL